MKRKPFFLAALMALALALASCDGTVTITSEQGDTTVIQLTPDTRYDIHIHGEINSSSDSTKLVIDTVVINVDDSTISDEEEGAIPEE